MIQRNKFHEVLCESFPEISIPRFWAGITGVVDHLIDKTRADNAKCDTNLTAVCRKMTNFIIFEAKIPCFKLENS